MSWTYKIATGDLIDPEGQFAGTGYSGKAGAWRNNPDMQPAGGVGPIPAGRYSIGSAHLSPNTGPITMNLDPLPGTNVFGRSLFRIHGDNANHDASHGCIILGPAIRRQIDASHDRVLTVVA
jgi:hypothetical protein